MEEMVSCCECGYSFPKNHSRGHVYSGLYHCSWQCVRLTVKYVAQQGVQADGACTCGEKEVFVTPDGKFLCAFCKTPRR